MPINTIILPGGKENMFNYSEYRVPLSMSLFVKKIWTLDNLENLSMLVDKYALPNGCFNIAIIRGNGLTVNHKNKVISLQKGTYFCGQMTEFIGIEIRPNSRATMVQLFPWTPMYFTDEDMDRYTDQFFRTDVIMPEVTEDLLLSNADICRMISEKWRPFVRQDLTARNLHLAASMIMKVAGEIEIKHISAIMGCSPRYLQKLFKKGLGISPKKFANIIRLRGVVDKLAFGMQRATNLTDLAVSNKFYDQAHFTNAFQNMFGTTPKQFSGKDYFLSYIK
ncbi:helix-turn-helix domain-containing protein [Pedobacter sp. WC2501]|uniref:helix-turn-helix domain-containing protein n=1 Tax=Pedobacter sp. WC2501 TaxID=3461400 RepID=UPI0040457437